MTAPTRIQRQRTRGWHMPDGAVYVGRPTRWGNPWAVGDSFDISGDIYGDGAGFFDRNDQRRYQHHAVSGLSAALAVELYETDLLATLADRGSYERGDLLRALRDLNGHDLACWCPLDQPCHADALLRVANR